MDARTAASLLSLTEEASQASRGPDAKAALQDLDREYGDSLAALQWFIDHENTDEALRLANALHRLWITKQRFDEGALWFERVLRSRGGG